MARKKQRRFKKFAKDYFLQYWIPILQSSEAVTEEIEDNTLCGVYQFIIELPILNKKQIKFILSGIQVRPFRPPHLTVNH